MKNEHNFDPEFIFVSHSLKKAIKIIEEECRNDCIDMPVGNGRNVFYLSKFFRKVTAVDINENYLNSIVNYSQKYDTVNGKIITSRNDLTNELPSEISTSDFICTIHYYSYSFLSRVIEKMNYDSYYFIETPNCNGRNFLKLPTENEIYWLLKDVNIIFLEKHNCCSDYNQNKHISFKCLLRK